MAEMTGLNELKLSFLPKEVGQSSGRKAYIDFLKVLAAFLTVFYHFAYYKLNYGFNAMQASYFPNFSRVVMCFASCCVPLFFMVNGTLMLGKIRSWKSVYKKAVKILALTIVWSLIGFPSWFFKTLIVLYILFTVFQYLYTKKITLYYVVILLVFIFPFGYNAMLLMANLIAPNLAIHILGKTINVADLSVTGFFTMYSILYFLICPILASRKIHTGYGIAALIIGVGLVLFECVTYTNVDRKMYDGVNAAFPTYGAMLLSIGIFIVVKNEITKCGKITNWLKDQILSIYLIHMALIRVVDSMFGLTSISLAVAIVGTALILFMCAGIGKVFCRIPVLCWLVRI